MRKNIRKYLKKILSFLNRQNIFIQLKKTDKPTLIIAGYTRSGTTYIANLLSDILRARCIHEPLHPDFSKTVAFFNEREAGSAIKNSPQHLDALKKIFSAEYKGKARDLGTHLIYTGRRVVKLVRANFYLDIISELNPDVPIVYIIRNPLAAINSRFRKGYDIPDHSKAVQDIELFLNQQQKDILANEKEDHKRMAISWCLDNIMALKNYGKPMFHFVFYEEFVDSFSEVKAIIDKTNLKIKDPKINKEILLYMKDEEKTAIFPASKLVKRLGEQKTDEILEVLKIFGFGDIYNYTTGKPVSFDKYKSN
ncbi:MAG: sulfotransferase [Bacteroidales bacterium]|nr:sulfotransferase [Bacteroidales bacterium]